MSYEFNFMVAPVELKPEMADMDSREIAQAVGRTLGQVGRTVAGGIDSLPPGGWEIVSHDLLRIDRHLLVTFLIRRPRPPMAQSESPQQE